MERRGRPPERGRGRTGRRGNLGGPIGGVNPRRTGSSVPALPARRPRPPSSARPGVGYRRRAKSHRRSVSPPASSARPGSSRVRARRITATGHPPVPPASGVGARGRDARAPGGSGWRSVSEARIETAPRPRGCLRPPGGLHRCPPEGGRRGRLRAGPAPGSPTYTLRPRARGRPGRGGCTRAPPAPPSLGPDPRRSAPAAGRGLRRTAEPRTGKRPPTRPGRLARSAGIQGRRSGTRSRTRSRRRGRPGPARPGAGPVEGPIRDRSGGIDARWLPSSTADRYRDQCTDAKASESSRSSGPPGRAGGVLRAPRGGVRTPS